MLNVLVVSFGLVLVTMTTADAASNTTPKGSSINCRCTCTDGALASFKTFNDWKGTRAECQGLNGSRCIIALNNGAKVEGAATDCDTVLSKPVPKLDPSGAAPGGRLLAPSP